MATKETTSTRAKSGSRKKPDSMTSKTVKAKSTRSKTAGKATGKASAKSSSKAAAGSKTTRATAAPPVHPGAWARRPASAW